MAVYYGTAAPPPLAVFKFYDCRSLAWVTLVKGAVDTTLKGLLLYQPGFWILARDPDGCVVFECEP